MRWTAALLATLVAPVAHATPEHVRNMDLEEQLDALDAPLTLPQGERHSVALRTWIFDRYEVENWLIEGEGAGPPGLYHAGYWVDGLVELRPYEQLTFNTRLALVNPASSYGVVHSSFVVPFVHVRLEESPNRRAVHPLTARLDLFDLDRQTFGAGLTLESKEMSGALVTVRQSTAAGDVRLRLVYAGTGGYDIGGDAHAYQLDWHDDALGALLFHTGLDEDGGLFGSSWFSSIYSTQAFGPLRYRAELSTREGGYAGLLGVDVEAQTHWLEISAGAQARRYGPGYFAGYGRLVQPDYLAIEQLDIPFANSSNFLVVGEAGDLLAATGDVRVRPFEDLWLVSENEVARFDTDRAVYRWFYRHALEYCWRGRVCGAVALTNKVSAAAGPPTHQHLANRFMFSDRMHVAYDLWFTL